MMTTKICGVSMQEIQKLRQFQFLLMKKKFGVRAVGKMEFIAYVQLKSETILIPQLIPIAVVDTNIHIDDGSIIIAKCRILKLIANNNQVIVKLKRPLIGFGSFLSLGFSNSNQKQEFINSIGEIVDDQSNSDSGQDVVDTPPTTDSSPDVGL